MESLWFAAAPSIDSDAYMPGRAYDRVGVGAGLLGLAAGLLARRGQKVAILEARLLEGPAIRGLDPA